eukprot:TRINITY_DN8603_c0_g1_i1.p1 TRINITY_DN8603_c0_g1~~TRINITY_DN8603_c0_g1_i1.p1  ORF type:complete len:446 (+),score=107.13 TRINITY_DN8603_c0_g1_i1:66-1403(+)
MMRRYVTVEPVQLFYGIMAMVSNVVRDHLFMEKACVVHLGYNSTICANLSGQPDIQNEVQGIVAELEIWDGVLVAVPALLFSLFLGSWSDAHGRKALLIIPFFGNILAFAAYIINYYFFFELGLYHLLWGSVVGLFGGYICLNIGLYGYISDVSSSSSRTTRLSILNGITSLSFVIGNIIGGQIFAATKSYYIIFGTSIVFGLLGIAYSVLFVKEERFGLQVDSSSSSPSTFAGLIDSVHIKECFRTTFRDRRPSLPRFGIPILVLNFSLLMFCLNTSHYDYLLFVKKFDWGVEDYSNFLIASRVIRFLGLFLLLPFLSSFLHLRDELLALLGTLLTALSYLLLALCKAPWMAYAAVSLQFNSIVSVSIRSQCSKAAEDENGKVFAVIALGQSLVPLVANPLFGLVYRLTLPVFPGAYLLIVSGLLVVSSIGATYLLRRPRRVEV